MFFFTAIIILSGGFETLYILQAGVFFKKDVIGHKRNLNKEYERRGNKKKTMTYTLLPFSIEGLCFKKARGKYIIHEKEGVGFDGKKQQFCNMIF